MPSPESATPQSRASARRQLLRATAARRSLSKQAAKPAGQAPPEVPASDATYRLVKA